MENPTTWDRTTRIIFNALCEAQAQRDQQVIGYSEARIIHDALNDAGLLAEGKIESLSKKEKELAYANAVIQQRNKELNAIHKELADAECEIKRLKMERDGVTEQDIAETMPPKPYES